MATRRTTPPRTAKTATAARPAATRTSGAPRGAPRASATTRSAAGRPRARARTRQPAKTAQPRWHSRIDPGHVALLAVLIALAACAVLLLDVYLGQTDPVHVLLLTAFGPLAFLVPVGAGAMVADFYRRHQGRGPWLHFEESCGVVLLFVAALTLGSLGGVSYSLVGNSLGDEVRGVIGTPGATAAVLLLLAIGIVLAFHITTAQGLRAAHAAGQLGAGTFEGLSRGRRDRRAMTAATIPAPRTRRSARHNAADDGGFLMQTTLPVTERAPVQLHPAQDYGATTTATADDLMAGDEPPLPSFHAADVDVDEAEDPPLLPDLASPLWPSANIELLDAVPPAVAAPSNNQMRAQIIEQTLASFNVEAQVMEMQSGPTVTQFGLRPAPGVRVQRITALANDLALALAAPSIRIEAPVPGKPVVGIEIPNGTTSLVTLREILESDACSRVKSPLRIALGKNVSGEPVVVDLAKMPHLLIAGATGSGKSVCLNSLIACLLFNNSPERLRLLMIDPKMVELTTFNGVPHLLAPVVTEMDKVSGTLKWMLKEMHRRYKLFGDAGARNIARYNEMMYEKMLAGEPQIEKNKQLPNIVFIIDELADLMMVSPAEVEDSISRLAALARATGIHLVLATQRPSVDVITGVIKANFPARIAFAVSSQVDSRTIIDHAGAEKLMGRGDMLYLPSDGSKVMRVQGTFLGDHEIERLVEFWSSNAPVTPMQIAPEDLLTPKNEDGEGEGNEDKLLSEATKVVQEYRRASVSLLQRRLSVGYSRAARLLDQLEERGVVGPSEDGRSRIVLDLGLEEDVAPEPAEGEDVEES